MNSWLPVDTSCVPTKPTIPDLPSPIPDSPAPQAQLNT